MTTKRKDTTTKTRKAGRGTKKPLTVSASRLSTPAAAKRVYAILTDETQSSEARDDFTDWLYQLFTDTGISPLHPAFFPRAFTMACEAVEAMPRGRGSITIGIDGARGAYSEIQKVLTRVSRGESLTAIYDEHERQMSERRAANMDAPAPNSDEEKARVGLATDAAFIYRIYADERTPKAAKEAIIGIVGNALETNSGFSAFWPQVFPIAYPLMVEALGEQGVGVASALMEAICFLTPESLRQELRQDGATVLPPVSAQPRDAGIGAHLAAVLDSDETPSEVRTAILQSLAPMDDDFMNQSDEPHSATFISKIIAHHNQKGGKRK